MYFYVYLHIICIYIIVYVCTNKHVYVYIWRQDQTPVVLVAYSCIYSMTRAHTGYLQRGGGEWRHNLSGR